MGLTANGSDNTDLQMGVCCGVQGVGDHNEDDENDSGGGCEDSYVHHTDASHEPDRCRGCYSYYERK